MDSTMTRPTPPETWTDGKLSRTALKLYDAVFLLGPRISFEKWWGKFFPDTQESSARRGWERWKAELREVGCPFELEGVPQAGDFLAEENEVPVHTIVLESYAAAMAFVDALIGPADPLADEFKPTGASIYDLFPGESHDDVDALMDSITDDILSDRDK